METGPKPFLQTLTELSATPLVARMHQHALSCLGNSPFDGLRVAVASQVKENLVCSASTSAGHYPTGVDFNIAYGTKTSVLMHSYSPLTNVISSSLDKGIGPVSLQAGTDYDLDLSFKEQLNYSLAASLATPKLSMGGGNKYDRKNLMNLVHGHAFANIMPNVTVGSTFVHNIVSKVSGINVGAQAKVNNTKFGITKTGSIRTFSAAFSHDSYGIGALATNSKQGVVGFTKIFSNKQTRASVAVDTDMILRSSIQHSQGAATLIGSCVNNVKSGGISLGLGVSFGQQ
ncbi:hypothetical protein PCE1_001596 [Barthelona sp. PCE]